MQSTTTNEAKPGAEYAVYLAQAFALTTLYILLGVVYMSLTVLVLGATFSGVCYVYSLVLDCYEQETGTRTGNGNGNGNENESEKEELGDGDGDVDSEEEE
ncbi:hypothetical protein EJ05DRAFT_500989 [Pseudovirgaria hyperparasitica]|uniref:Uncharacterized protein n=1 Tax=Pseudovirgaria hyperparasitica TaxID=470096 RepID=A0A6A6W4A9_9PEZI|nr:uncharacterized protein EJ05DRAFT_500989 [Pseudovirgaria hyperparasitica]KAF2757453.1 hypothetical protein EJ05DRAFT_500989 [Pseudovirgaria hyperparasitica]